MPDQEQAARIAAMRARRGQAPINIEITSSAQPAEAVAPAQAAQAVLATVSLSSSIMRSRMTNFCTLPVTVIGISNDDIATLKRFSIEACRNKFAVAADPEAKIAKQYDAKIKMMDMADRVSFVLSPDGKVIFSHTAMSPAGHITETLKAVQAWKAQQTAPAKP